jgi:signal transduction histidine kinase
MTEAVRGGRATGRRQTSHTPVAGLERLLAPPRPPSPISRYLLAVALTGLAFGITLGLRSMLGEHGQLLFFGAVVVSAILGGLGPGLVATLLSVVAIDYLLVGHLPFPLVMPVAPDQLIRLALFTVVALVTSGVSGSLRTSRETAERQARELARQAVALEKQATELSRQVAESRALSAALERSNARLREVAATADEARVAAETANRAKLDFLATMSHELRTPLNAISGYVELLKLEVGGPLAAQQRQYLDRVQHAQRHLLGLINNVLNFAKLESGRVEYAMTDVPVDLVLRSMHALVQPQVAAKSIAYDYRPTDRALTVRADREKLEQIVLNLLSNAVKFTPSGGRIALSGERGPNAGGGIAIIVEDSGVGIPPDKLDAIFEPFVQVGPALTRERDGAGLGLAISRDLARAMGGDLSVTSQVGAGSRFTLVLPAR